MTGQDPRLSAKTLECLDVLVRVLDVLADSLDDDDLREALPSLVQQAVKGIVYAEDRLYSVVKVADAAKPVQGE